MFTEGVREAGERTRTAGVETVTRMNEENMQDSEKKMSIRAEYSQEIEEWHRDRRPDGESFVLGMTGDVLQGLGAIESDIYINGDKIKEILKDHPEMTLEEIKKIPQILEDPVLILKSRNVGRGGQMNSRMVIFGAVKAENGHPVMSVLDLHPTENNFTISDMQKVTSAYTKTTSPVQFVKDSFIVYADKKRTASLLRSIGFQMPIELNKSGSIGSISYKGRSVNIFGEKFSDVFVEGQRKYSIEETDDTAYLAAVERGDMETAQKMVDETAKKGDIRYSIDETPETPDVSENRDLTDRDMLLAMAERLVGNEKENEILTRYKEQHEAQLRREDKPDSIYDEVDEQRGSLYTDPDAAKKSAAFCADFIPTKNKIGVFGQKVKNNFPISENNISKPIDKSVPVVYNGANERKDGTRVRCPNGGMNYGNQDQEARDRDDLPRR